MIRVVLSVPLQETHAFSPSILQPIPLSPFPWENLNDWNSAVLFSGGNLPIQQPSSPCQKYSSMDIVIPSVNALFQKVGLFPSLDGKAKTLQGLALFLVPFCWCWVIPWAFCFNEPSLALHWNWRSLVSLVWLINHSLLTVVWGSSKYRKPWEIN